MKKKMQVLALRFLLAITVFVLCGCWNARELRDLPIVSGIGIDTTMKNTKDVALTVQVVKPSEIRGSSSSGGENPGEAGTHKATSKAFWNIHNSGSSVFEALRGMTHIVNFKLYLAHNQVIIISKDVAQKGVRPILDYFYREIETRPVTDIFISKTKASEILEVEPEIEALPAIDLVKLAKAQEFTSSSIEINLQEFVRFMLSKTTSAVVPMVSLVEENDEQILHVEGLAVFKNDKMVGELDNKETRGLLWVKGKVTYGIVKLQYADHIVNLEIVSERTKVYPEIRDGKIFMSIQIKEECVLMEQLSADNLATSAVFKKLQELQNEEIKKEILAAYEKAKSMDADIFGFGELLHKKYPKEWKKMEDSWDALFKKINLVIEVESIIRDTGIISKPIKAE